MNLYKSLNFGEIEDITEEIKELIMSGKSSIEIKKAALEQIYF